MLKEDNRYLYAVIAGIIGALVKDLLGLFLVFIGIAHFFAWNLAADFFVQDKEIFTFWGYIVGGVTDLFLGSLVGFIFAVFIEVFGPKHYILKGIGIAWFTWGFLVGFIVQLFRHSFSTEIGSISALIYTLTLITHCLMGVAMSYAYIKLAKIE